MPELYGYDKLIEQFLNHEISIEQFEREYTDKFLRSGIWFGEDLFPLLDWFFVIVEGYTDDPEFLESGSPFDSSETQLRDAAAETLQKLRALK